MYFLRINEIKKNLKYKEVKKSSSIKSFVSDVTFPNVGFGISSTPKSQSIHFKNATIWTNEKEGIIENSDILIDSQSLCTFYLDDGSIKTFQKVNFITKNKITQNIGSIRAFFEYKWSDSNVVELSVVFDSETINKEVKFYKNSLKNLPIGN